MRLWGMSRGATLLELLLVLAVAAVLSAVAIPRGATALDGILTRQAAERIVLGHQRARQVALAMQAVAQLTVTAESVTVRVRDTLHWSLPGPGTVGAALSGGDPVTLYAPNGLAMGSANVRYDLARGRARLAVLVSRLGRARIVRPGG